MVLSEDKIFEFRQNIFRELRNELGHLKTCQTTLFLGAITASGVLLGLIGPLDEDAMASAITPYLLLVPLLILLPLWLIFYDKERTIARIVGFLRVQERLAIEDSTEGVIGWESAMQKYWKVRDGYDGRDYDAVFYCAKQRQLENQEYSKTRESIFNSTYWSTVYSIFFLFSLICLISSFGLMTRAWSDTIKILLGAFFFFTLLVCLAETRYRFIYRIVMTFFFNNDKIPYKPPHRKFYAIMKEMGALVFLPTSVLVLLIYISNIASNGIIPIIVLIFFASLFISIASVTFWMLTQLIKGYNGRYSYKSFQMRWEIALMKEAWVYSEYGVFEKSKILASGDNLRFLPLPWSKGRIYLYKFMPNAEAQPTPDFDIIPVPELYFAMILGLRGLGDGLVKQLKKPEAKKLYEKLQEKRIDAQQAFPIDRDVWGIVEKKEDVVSLTKTFHEPT